MVNTLKDNEIMENLGLLADWLRVKHPGERFELTVAGGAAMILEGFKDQTKDIDLLKPQVLPDSIIQGIEHIGRVKKLSPEWLNTNLAHMLSKVIGAAELPAYFNEISRTIEVSDNLKISLIGRQALISLKMYASTPSYSKHTEDISNLRANKEEITEAVRFVVSIDNSNPRQDDLRIVLKRLGFNFDEIHRGLTRKDRPSH